MRITCPTCSAQYPLSAGLAEDEGKRLAVLFADMEPVLARAVIGYLRLFKPAKMALRTSRAIRIIEDLAALVRPGTVCRDERSGRRRPAPPALWAAGIEQMLSLPGGLDLPLANHHYLRAVVYGLADQADAAGERRHEAELRAGRNRRQGVSPQVAREDPLTNQLKWLADQLRYGQIDKDQHAEHVRQAQARLGGKAK